jgi:serine/threonine-protein kinase HipA
MDAAPDSWGRRVIDAQRRAAGLPPANELEYLLTGSDAGRWGALRFLGDGQHPIGSDSPGADLSSLDELSAAVARFERTGNVAPLLARFVAAASSAGGARPKALIVDGERHYIAKFTSAMDQNATVERAEVLALKLAQEAGIEAPEAQILGSRDMPIALIERFDRKIVKDRLQRRHVISAQSFLGAQFADEGDYADLAEQMRAHAEAGQLREIYARVAFNVLVRSTDDHLKNHAFIHAGSGRWRMSPVFDVNPQPERHGQLKTYINGRADATVDNLLSGHEAFGLSLEEARQIVEGIAGAVANRWRSLAREVGMSRKDIDYYAAAFEHEELRAAQRRPAPKSRKGR